MISKRPPSLLTALVTFLLLGGCGGDEATVVNVSQGVITARGATVPGQTTTIRDVDGFGVTVTPEALPSGVEAVELVLGIITNPRNLDPGCAIGVVRFVEVERVRPAASFSEVKDLQYNLKEEFFEFASAVTVILPYRPEDIERIDDPRTEAGVDTFEPGIESWVPVSDEDVSIDTDAELMLVETEHFSQFVMVDRPGCVRPVIHSIQPAFGPPGTVVSLFGENFLSGSYEPRVLFANGAETGVIDQSDFSLEFIVPQDAGSGPLRVKVGPFISDSVDFIVTGGSASPVLTSLSPGSGPPCTVVNLRGVNLAGSGGQPGEAVQVNFGTFPVDPILATSSSVTFEAPCDAVEGTYQVSLRRGGLTSNALSFTVTAVGASSVSGRVGDQSGQPLSGVTVTTLGTDSDLLTGTTDDEGRYTLTNVLPGQRVIAFSRPGMATRSRLTVVENSVPLFLDAVLSPLQGPVPVAPPAIDMGPPEVNEVLGLATVSGDIANLDGSQAVVTNNGNDAILSIFSPFQQSVILTVGNNRIRVRASNALGTARSQIFNVDFMPGANFIFRATLSWSQNATDLDIHAWYENLEHCSYVGDTDNLRLDVDNTTGFGPENITSATDPPDGAYYIAVNYYEGAVPVDAVVSVTINPGTAFEEVRSFGPYRLTEDNFDDGYPVTTNTGSWWRPVDIEVFNSVASFRPVDTNHELRDILPE